MASIRLLSEILSNQIAAGEVVQRPASVVKELVENSMDAHATRITIEIEGGGKTLIQISDDGCGLARDQALLAVERYATSKIFTQEDLFSISTFGFRGEALPSIASISKFCLVSRSAGQESGTKIEIAGGKMVRVSDIGAPVGTLVAVRQLFYNVPARRKFLKGETTETGHIVDAVSGLALGNPGIGFRLFINKKLVKHFPPGQDLFQRAQRVLGKEAADRLYPLELNEETLSITGVCSNPLVTRSSAGRIYLFVNHRLVSDRGLVAAVFAGYQGRLMKGRYPLGVICVNLPFDQVDVNVHPSKREIKLLAAQPVYQAVSRAVGNALAKASENAILYAQTRPLLPASQDLPGPVSPAREPAGRGNPYAAERVENSLPGQVHQSTRVWDASPAAGFLKQEAERVFHPDSNHACETGQVLFPEISMEKNRPKILGQVMGTYIVAEKEGHLVLIDQHAAHERVVYETLKKRHQTLAVQSQSLLVPEVFDLTHGEADILNRVLGELSGLGLKIEPFGGTSFVIKAIPALLEEKHLKPLVLEIIDTLGQDRVQNEEWIDACLVSMACHRAIRAHKAMNMPEMAKLVEDLESCDNSLHCPHGRPTMVSFDPIQMQKLFKRRV